MSLLGGLLTAGGVLGKIFGKAAPWLKGGEGPVGDADKPSRFAHPVFRWFMGIMLALFTWELVIKEIILTYWPNARLPVFSLGWEDLLKIISVVFL